MDASELAIDRWPQILMAAGIDKSFLKKKHGPCPVCGGKDRFRFIDKDGKGTFFCSGCGPGDGFKLLINYKDFSRFADAADFVRNVVGNVPVERTIRNVAYVAQKQAEEKAEKEKRKISLQKTWNYSKPVKRGDPVSKYLTITRKLPIENVPATLRFNPRMDYYEESEEDGQPDVYMGKFPVMIAMVQDKFGRPVGLHRTYLSQDGTKALVKKGKKLMKGLGVSGGAIRLFKCEETLAVTEGIETAFAVYALTGQPVWACISATILENFQPPEGVKTILIYADNDLPDSRGRRAGQQAAKALAERLTAEGYTVKLNLPIAAGTDFHDVWTARLKTQEIRKEKQAAGKKVA